MDVKTMVKSKYTCEHSGITFETKDKGMTEELAGQRKTFWDGYNEGHKDGFIDGYQQAKKDIMEMFNNIINRKKSENGG